MADIGAQVILDISGEDLITAIKVLEKIAKLHPNFHECKKRSRDDADLPESGESASNSSACFKGNELNKDIINIYKHPSLRPFRKALVGAYEVHSLMQLKGIPLEDLKKRKDEERTIKRQKAAEKEQQKLYIASTELRRGRVEKLESLKDSAKDEELIKLTEFMIPDGHVDTMYPSSQQEQRLLLNGNTEDTGAETTANEHKVTAGENSGRTLPYLRSCYVCKVRYRYLHRVRKSLCM